MVGKFSTCDGALAESEGCDCFDIFTSCSWLSTEGSIFCSETTFNASKIFSLVACSVGENFRVDIRISDVGVTYVGLVKGTGNDPSSDDGVRGGIGIVRERGTDDESLSSTSSSSSFPSLPTLGKALEAVVADRLFYVVEAYTLLPINHFEVRKQWFTEQALMLLQERIYRVWRQRKILSLISFDIKGVYNEVYKERLLQRLHARRISSSLCQWVNVFCSNWTATLSVNEYDSVTLLLPKGS